MGSGFLLIEKIIWEIKEMNEEKENLKDGILSQKNQKPKTKKTIQRSKMHPKHFRII